jgi:hypothetical protein
VTRASHLLLADRETFVDLRKRSRRTRQADVKKPLIAAGISTHGNRCQRLLGAVMIEEANSNALLERTITVVSHQSVKCMPLPATVARPGLVSA